MKTINGLDKIKSIQILVSWIATVLIISGSLIFYHNFTSSAAINDQKNIINGILQNPGNLKQIPGHILILPIENGAITENDALTGQENQNPSSDQTSSQNNIITATNTPTPGPTPTPNPGITAAQVATHNSSGNCWLTISNKVYNLTSFLSIHSGGSSTISPYCGKDATTYFLNRHPQGSYINYLVTHLYYQGDLANIAPTPTPIPTATPTTTPVPTASPTPTPTPTTAPTPAPTTYTVNISSNGTITPSSLIIAVNDTIKFVYSGSGDEVVLRFTPNPPNDIKLDHEKTQTSYKFTQSENYTVRINNTIRLNITVN